MAALTPLSQLSSGNPAYESFYRQVDPGNTGKVGTLCQIWDLSDIDKDGHLDKEEFSVAMHLVYAAREKESVPSTLPSALIPPSKHKKIAGALPGSVPILPSTPFLLNENLRPTPVLSKSPLGSSTNLSPSRQPQTHTQVTGGHTAYGETHQRAVLSGDAPDSGEGERSGSSSESEPSDDTTVREKSRQHSGQQEYCWVG